MNEERGTYGGQKSRIQDFGGVTLVKRNALKTRA